MNQHVFEPAYTIKRANISLDIVSTCRVTAF